MWALDLADDRGLGDEARDAHSLAASAQQRVDLVHAANQPRPRIPAGSLDGTGRAKSSLLAGKGDEIFIPAGIAPDARESDLGKAAIRESLDGLRNDPAQRTEGPLEPVFVFLGEAVEIMVKDSVERGPLGSPGAVEFRFIDS
jgi:hypothetical protein